MEYIETNCTIEHEGQKFESGGACVNDTYVIGYPSGNLFNNPEQIDSTEREGRWYVFTDWHGKAIGRIMFNSSWRVHSWLGSYMHSGVVVIDGVKYVGRGFGFGMSFKALRRKHQ